MKKIARNTVRGSSAGGALSQVHALAVLRVEKASSYRKAEADYEGLMLHKPDPVTPWWTKQAAHAEALLKQHMRAHNVARLNKCTGQFLKPIGLAFRFVDTDAGAKPQMRLCRQVGREFLPLDHGPRIDDEGLHDDERVSSAIWRALEIAKAER